MPVNLGHAFNAIESSLLDLRPKAGKQSLAGPSHLRWAPLRPRVQSRRWWGSAAGEDPIPSSALLKNLEPYFASKGLATACRHTKLYKLDDVRLHLNDSKADPPLTMLYLQSINPASRL